MQKEWMPWKWCAVRIASTIGCLKGFALTIGTTTKQWQYHKKKMISVHTEKGKTMYKSPIDVFITDIEHQIVKQRDDEIYQAVASVGINVDKEELLRALRYDRQQYEAGYLAGQADAMASIVRCKGCKFALTNPFKANQLVCSKPINWRAIEPDHFCSYGERREGE